MKNLVSPIGVGKLEKLNFPKEISPEEHSFLCHVLYMDNWVSNGPFTSVHLHNRKIAKSESSGVDWLDERSDHNSTEQYPLKFKSTLHPAITETNTN